MIRAQRSAARSGRTPPPRAGRGDAQRGLLRASYGSGACHTVGGSRGDAMLRYRELLDDVRSYAGNRTDYLQNRMRELTLSRTDLDAMIPFAVTGGTWVVDVHRQSDIEALLRLAAEKRLTFAFTGAEEAWKVAPALAAAGSFVIVQSFSNLPGSFDELGSREDNAALLDKAGVKVILTTAETHNARNLRYVAGNAVRAGMPWQRALASVTLHPAMLAGLDKDYGDVTVGRVANLVVWSGDPFETSTTVQHLMVRGERLPTTSRQHDLLRRYRSMDAYQRP
jgi:imidazolonepropionase-like amidohydrolase